MACRTGERRRSPLLDRSDRACVHAVQGRLARHRAAARVLVGEDIPNCQPGGAALSRGADRPTQRVQKVSDLIPRSITLSRDKNHQMGEHLNASTGPGGRAIN